MKHLLSLCDRFAPGTSDLVVDTLRAHPPKIEQHFGITRGHIHHVDNALGFTDRLPYATPVERPLLVQRRVPPGRLGHRCGGPQRRPGGARGPGALEDGQGVKRPSPLRQHGFPPAGCLDSTTQ